MTPRVSLFCLTLLLAAPGVSAQEAAPEARRLSLADAVALARAHSARLGQLRSLADAADAAQRGARAARQPQLELSAGYTRQSDVPELTLSVPGLGTRTLFPNINDTWRTRAAASLPLWTGGRLERTIDAAQSQRQAAGLDLEAGAHDLELETVAAYWALVTARASETVLGEALASFEKHVADAQARQDVGLAARNEVLAVEVERDRAELQRLRARMSADVAEADLLRLVGLPPGTSLAPDEPIEVPPSAPVDAAEAARAALQARPEVQSLRARVDGADALARAQQGAGRPQVQATAAYDLARPNTRVLPLADEWNGTWSVGVSVSWNAFDGGRTSAAVAQARAQAEALRRQLQDAERRVQLEVTQRALELRHAEAALQVAARARASAAENARVAADRYHEGVGSSTDLLDAETGLLRAGLEHTAAAANVRTAQAALRRAQGATAQP